jgi:hypothetical protein
MPELTADAVGRVYRWQHLHCNCWSDLFLDLLAKSDGTNAMKLQRADPELYEAFSAWFLEGPALFKRFGFLKEGEE